MTYAVMQTSAEPPTAEQLKHAFQQVPGLTAIDANNLARDAYGILVKGLELEQSTAMQSALAAQGLQSEVVEDAALMELPPPRRLTKVEFTPEGLGIYDLMGRSVPLAWKDFLVVAAGRVRFTEFKSDLVDRVVTRAAGRHLQLKVVTEVETKEEKNDHLLLEIITTGASLRYHTVADQPEAHLLFQSLGERRSRDPTVNLALFVQELANFAPGVLLNHGAYYMCENSHPAFTYPSQTAFYREITWLLRMVSSGRTEPPCDSAV
jgi:hypothetical protein